MVVQVVENALASVVHSSLLLGHCARVRIWCRMSWCCLQTLEDLVHPLSTSKAGLTALLVQLVTRTG